MPEIEFLDAPGDGPFDRPPPRARTRGDGAIDPDPPPGRSDDPDPPHRPTAAASLAAFLPEVLTAGAAVAALLACWRPVVLYRERFGESNFTSTTTTSVDGWGTYSTSFDQVPQHGTRYGIPLCVAAGLLVAAVVLGLLAQSWRPRRRPARPATTGRAGGVQRALAVGALGLLAGTLASAALTVQAARDNFVAQRARFGDQTSLRIEFGSLLWFGTAAVALTVLALVAPPLLRRLGPVAEPDPPADPLPLPVVPRYVPHADDDLLDV